MTPEKPIVSPEETLERLDIRVGQVLSAEIAEGTPKPAYVLTIDFGKRGTRISVGRFTSSRVEDLVGQKVVAVLNFERRRIGEIDSEVLVLGLQFPKAASLEATPLVPLNENVKLGGKVF